MKSFYFLTIFLAGAGTALAQQDDISVSSPDKNITVVYHVVDNSYDLKFKDEAVMQQSKMGIVRDDADFSQKLRMLRPGVVRSVQESYSMLTAKKSNISYSGNERIVELENENGRKMNIVFRVSNDGLAFRYIFPDSSAELKHILSESTSFHFPEGTRAWLQPKTEAQSGWEHSNPSYEAHYMMDIAAGTPAPGNNGWVYPALFHYKNAWMLITEAALGRTYCGTALQQNSPGNEYRINFPETAEKFTNGALNPESTLPWRTPWRIVVVGEMKTLVESTLGTDLAQPAVGMDHGFIQPGKASWSWILKKDDSTVYSIQKKYIDFAADMTWAYCLVDAEWDKRIGYDSIRILSEYAKSKNVGLLLWYNSAGNWNTVKYTPRDKLLTHESREKEFSLLESMGIRGIKVDFFAGDGQSMINYYQDILLDAAAHHLLVNFHGATLPRGWARTFPNLMTTEAVYGYEMITFNQRDADLAPAHIVMCALARNAFDPMDFTPMCLYKIPRIQRTTSAAFELATSVLFMSGIQHYAESPDGMAHVPGDIQDFLRGLPGSWDDVRFVDGYPGKWLVIARKSGRRWYVAGINAEKSAKLLNLDLAFIGATNGRLIANGADNNGEPSFSVEKISLSSPGKLEIKLGVNDGFVAIFE